MSAGSQAGEPTLPHAKATKAAHSKARPLPTRVTKAKAKRSVRPTEVRPAVVPVRAVPGAVAPSQTKAAPVMTAPPARDPQIAIQEEFDAAQATNTVAAWDLFIARHNGNPLVPRAQAELNKLKNPKP